MRPQAAAAPYKCAGVILAGLGWLTACCPVVALKPVVEMPRIPPLPTIQAEEWDRCPDVYARAAESELLIRGAFADCMVILEEMTDAYD